MTTEKVIVSRHPAAIEFVRQETGEEMPVLATATADDVQGKHVYGNLPFALAAVASAVTVIEFAGSAPRGAEYGLVEMRAAGAHLQDYVVLRGSQDNVRLRAARGADDWHAAHGALDAIATAEPEVDS